MKKVILAGGSGSLGKLLADEFIKRNWKVIVLTRDVANQELTEITYVHWDGKNLGNWVDSLEAADILINLSGKSIQCRFSAKNKKELYESRIYPTQILDVALQSLLVKPKIWINFSGVSLFSDLSSIQDEKSKEVGTGFLAELSKNWEKAFFANTILDVNKVALRISPVLIKDSGFFAELLPLVKLGLGGKVADGKQWMSWIHHEDLVRLIFWIIEQKSPAEIYHACSPNPSSNEDFMKIFRNQVGVSVGLPLPKLMARAGAFFKGVDSSLLLDSVPVTTTSTMEEGFVFLYPNAELAIRQLLSQST